MLKEGQVILINLLKKCEDLMKNCKVFPFVSALVHRRRQLAASAFRTSELVIFIIPLEYPKKLIMITAVVMNRKP